MVVVFGSINLDLVARVARLPRPGETLAGSSFATSPGGKGANQALAARRAGAVVALFGAVGRDAFAAPALALLDEAGIDLAGVRATDAATGVALIHVDDAGQNAITVVPGANALARAADVPDAVLGPATMLMLQFETPHAAPAPTSRCSAPSAAMRSQRPPSRCWMRRASTSRAFAPPMQRPEWR